MPAPPLKTPDAHAPYFHPLFKNFQIPFPLREVIKMYSPPFKKKGAGRGVSELC